MPRARLADRENPPGRAAFFRHARTIRAVRVFAVIAVRTIVFAVPRAAPRRARIVLAAGPAAALALLLVPAVTRAADLVADGACYAGGQPIALSGTAFTPGAPVTISGAAIGGAQADALGAFATQVAAPALNELGPRAMRLTAVDRVNPANTATLELRVVREAFGSNLPIAGRPRQTTTWHFAGFIPDQPIYGHFVLRGRSRGDYRFGVAGGACGTLTVRAARIPGVRTLRPGRWTLKLDQRMTYSASAPGSAVTFRMRRRSRG